MQVFSRSWQIAKLSFGVIGKDKEMLIFPFLAGLFSLLYSIALLFPTIIVDFLGQTALAPVAFGVVEYAVLFVTYLGLSFIATFFNVCVVYTAKVRFSGGDATFFESLRFAMSKIGLIFMWSMLAATVGILLRVLDQIAERLGPVGKILLSLLRAVLGMIWSIVTIFVVPAMVYDDLTPIDAIKKSAQTLKKTWGESLVRHYGMGLVSSLFAILGVFLSVGLFVGMAFLGPIGLIMAAGVSALYFLVTFLVFNCANSVFNTALYYYANNGECPEGFDMEIMKGAFRTT